MAVLRKTFGKADAPYAKALTVLIKTQSKTTICNWSIGYAEQSFLPLYEKSCPGDFRPRAALDAARQWLKGEVKLPFVRKFILSAHKAAREAENNPVAQAAARAVSHAASSIHVPMHAMGLAFYGSAAIAYEMLGLKAAPDEYEELAAKFFDELRKDLLCVCAQE